MEYSELKEALKVAEIELSDEQIENFKKYQSLLASWNEVMNLTGITEEKEVILKHFYDSLLFMKADFLKLLPSDAKIADLGSGAGFPGLPLAIVFPNFSFYLIEPLQKRCSFLEAVVKELKLTNVTVLNKRAEELEENRESFDLLTGRAVTATRVFLELGTFLVKKDGYLVILKGKYDVTEMEVAESATAMKLLSLELVKVDKIHLSTDERTNLYFKKLEKTNLKYPRQFAKIKKQPL